MGGGSKRTSIFIHEGSYITKDSYHIYKDLSITNERFRVILMLQVVILSSKDESK